MALVTVASSDAYYTASYQFTQSITGSFQKESTVQVSFDVGGSGYGGAQQRVYFYSSETGSSYVPFYSSSFNVGVTTATQNFNAPLVVDADSLSL